MNYPAQWSQEKAPGQAQADQALGQFPKLVKAPLISSDKTFFP